MKSIAIMFVLLWVISGFACESIQTAIQSTDDAIIRTSSKLGTPTSGMEFRSLQEELRALIKLRADLQSSYNTCRGVTPTPPANTPHPASTKKGRFKPAGKM